VPERLGMRALIRPMMKASAVMLSVRTRDSLFMMPNV
jgi:hypothetical protein